MEAPLTISDRPKKAERATDASLQRLSPVALHRQLADRLRESIEQGELKPGDQLPTDLELVQRFGISRITVRQAFRQLVREGLVVRQRGKGTFVALRRVRHDLQVIRGFYEDLVVQGLDVATSLISLDSAVAPEPIAKVLGSGDQPVITWRRLYTVDNAPFAVADVHLAPLDQPITRKLVERHMTYTIFEEHLGIKIDKASMTIRAISPDEQLQRLLGVSQNDAVLALERVSYSEAGRALEHTTYMALGTKYEFSLVVQGRMPITQRFRVA